MATAPAEALEPQGGAEDNDNTAIDFEAEARKMGWRPLEEFKGAPEQHVDAETFYKRGQEMMPLLKAENKHLRQRIDQLEKNFAKASDFFSKAEERAYQRALDDLKARGAEALKAGDAEAMAAVVEETAKLEKPGARVDTVDPDQRIEEFADWSKANRWYADNEVMRVYADAQAEKLARTKNGFLDRGDLDAVAEKVREKFEDMFPDAFGTAKPAPKPRSPVDGGGSAPPRRTGRSFADLPPEAQRICDKWVANGIIKDRETYVKNYQWDKK